MSRELGDRDALQLKVERLPQLDVGVAARLSVRASDGVPHHLRFVQPIQVREHAKLFVTATLLANRPTRARLGIQERIAPYRVVFVDEQRIGTEPRRLRLNVANPHPELRAQLQLDIGYCAPGTTVWLSDVTVHDLRATR